MRRIREEYHRGKGQSHRRSAGGGIYPHHNILPANIYLELQLHSPDPRNWVVDKSGKLLYSIGRT